MKLCVAKISSVTARTFYALVNNSLVYSLTTVYFQSLLLIGQSCPHFSLKSSKEPAQKSCPTSTAQDGSLLLFPPALDGGATATLAMPLCPWSVFSTHTAYVHFYSPSNVSVASLSDFPPLCSQQHEISRNCCSVVRLTLFKDLFSFYLMLQKVRRGY